MDEESGLYYYGARYYDPRFSLWNSTDPLSGFNPVFEEENYFDGEHNGGLLNSFNHGTYNYCYQNPLRYLDPNGKQVDVIDFIPLVGSGRDIYRGVRDGDWVTLGLGIGGLALDIGTFGSGTLIKTGVKAGIKTVVKEVAEQETKQIVKKLITKTEQLAINKAVGAAAEKTVTKQLIKKYAGSTVGSQISARFKDGSKVVFDNVVVAKDGAIKLINETKSGLAKLSPQQARFFEGGETVTFVGQKAKDLKILNQSVNKSKIATIVTKVK